VEPRINRLTRDGTSIQIELKMMDVLVCLAEHAGELVKRRQLIYTVWATEFISATILTRAIALLRNALGDDAMNPSFIETIHRRGYRLIAPVERVGSDEPSTSKVARFPVSERRAGEEERSPYPGLAAFTEEDAEFFFGREAEVSQLWRKLTTRRLLAVIGPSGVGKSSYLRAGLMPVAPEGWDCLICQPGEEPFASLARALVPEFEGDPEVILKPVNIGDETTAVAIASRWRERHEQALLVIDQFEELFTLNPPEVQKRFAELLAQLARDADVHVLLSMRDDFLYRCHDHDALMPIFSELTPVKVPAAEDLRRALVQPASRFGYSFDDDGLADEMLEAVKGERGALPMLAFAVSRLWEKRDKEKKELNRSAYETIGGVSGALAQHAESTLTAIGQNRISIVRELFHNLVTGEGTRATREVENLLSVFTDAQREEAEQVLRRLIHARLLTSFEEDVVEGNSNHHRVEVVHESLLTSWPRLVRWQTQDADAIQLRDQLRQAARTWGEHDRTRDYLWTGKAYREFSVWRENYPGGLTELEEGFARALTAHAKRRKRRRRIAVAATFVVLLAILAIVGSFWRRSVREARRAEGSELVAVGRLELESYPSAAVAYAMASLELADRPAARRLALDALWKGPTAIIVNEDWTMQAQFTSDGRWLVQSQSTTGTTPLRLIGADGSSRVLEHTQAGHAARQEAGIESGIFGLVGWDKKGTQDVVSVWSAPENRRLAEAQYKRRQIISFSLAIRSDQRRMITAIREEDGRVGIDTLSFDGDHTRLGTIDLDLEDDENRWLVDMNRRGRWIAASTGHDVYVIEIGDHGLSEPRRLGRQEASATRVEMDERGRFVATADAECRIRLWNLDGTTPPTLLQGPPAGCAWLWSPIGAEGFLGAGDRTTSDGNTERWIWSLETAKPQLLRRFDRGPGVAVWWNTEHFVWTGRDLKIRLWPFAAPADAEPLFLLRGEIGQLWYPRLHPAGKWLVVPDNSGLSMWPLARPYPAVIRRHDERVNSLVFGPEGRWLASSSDDRTVRVWPLVGVAPPPGRVLVDDPNRAMGGLARSPNRKQLLAGTGFGGARLLSLGDDPPIALATKDTNSAIVYMNTAFSPDGLLATASLADLEPAARKISIWNLASQEQVAVFAEGESRYLANPQFIGNDHLLALDTSGLRRWNIDTNESDLLFEGTFQKYAVSEDRRRVLLLEAPTHNDPGRAIFVDLETGVVTPLETHGYRVETVALDIAGTLAVTGDRDGVVRVGPVTGEEPHVLLGHDKSVDTLALDPHGRWIASGGKDKTVRLWPMPDLSKPPLHTLPREELIAKLKTLTNLRVVRDEDSTTGWKLEVGPFPGWETVPTW